jgi:mannose-6-phosphate isomerase-like protein (cupin superfamily)
MNIRIIVVSCLVLASVSLWAQQRSAQPPQAQAAAPLQGGQVTAAELAAIVARQPKDRNGNQTFLQLAPYNVSMEHRVNVPQNAAVHDKEAELFYVIDGSATLVTGGRLVNPTRNGDNSQAASVEGGTPKKISKGDFILVPEATAHWFSAIDGELTLMSLHLPRTAAK